MRAAARRVPRKIGQDDDKDDDETNGSSAPTLVPDDNKTFVKRPPKASRGPQKANKASSLRTSIASADLSQDDTEDSPVRLKPHSTPRLLQRSAQLRSSPANALPVRAGALDGRPSYSSDHLAELKNSTPSTPHNAESEGSASRGSAPPPGLDIDSKFGPSALALALQHEQSQLHIPTEAEIREKKERRRRLAKESDYISLNDDGNGDANVDSDDSETEDPRSKSLIIHADEVDIPSKYAETRLVHEDEDMAEGFDDFVEDQGKVALGRKAAKEQERQRRKEIEEQIKSAQHGYGYAAGDEASDESSSEENEEAARNAAYEAAQTRAGAYGMKANFRKEMDKEERLKKKLELPKVRAVPDFKAVVGRFATMVSAKELEIETNRKRLAKLEQEQEEIEGDEIRVKTLLGDAGERYEKLREDAVAKPVKGAGESGERGLENLATMVPVDTHGPRQIHESQQAQHSYGFPSTLIAGTGDASSGMKPSGMARIPTEEDEYDD